MYDVIGTLVKALGIWSVVAVIAWFAGIFGFSALLFVGCLCVCCWDRIVVRKEEEKKKKGLPKDRKYPVVGRCGHWIPQECHSACVSCLLSSGEGSQNPSIAVQHWTCHWLLCTAVNTKKQTVCDLFCSICACGWCCGNFLVWIALLSTIIYAFGLVVPWQTLEYESPDVGLPIVVVILVVLIAFLALVGAIFLLFFLRAMCIWCLDNGKCMNGVEEGDGKDRYTAGDCCGEKCADNKCCTWFTEWCPVLASIKSCILLQNTLVLVLGFLMILLSFVQRMEKWMLYWGIFLVVLACVIYVIVLTWILLRRFCDACLNRIEDFLETRSDDISVSPITKVEDVEMENQETTREGDEGDDEEEEESWDDEEEFTNEEAGEYEFGEGEDGEGEGEFEEELQVESFEDEDDGAEEG